MFIICKMSNYYLVYPTRIFLKFLFPLGWRIFLRVPCSLKTITRIYFILCVCEKPILPPLGWERGRDELSRTTGKRMGKKWQNYRGYRYPPATGTEYRYLTTFLQNVLVVEQIFLPYQYIHNFTTRVWDQLGLRVNYWNSPNLLKRKPKAQKKAPFFWAKWLNVKAILIQSILYSASRRDIICW